MSTGDRLRRLRPLDRAALAALLALGACGPWLSTHAARVLDPAGCVALAWERAGGGDREHELVVEKRPGVEGAPRRLLAEPPLLAGADPWGTPFYWREVGFSWWGGLASSRETTTFWAYSHGPTGSADDDILVDASPPSGLRRALLWWPALPTLIAIGYGVCLAPPAPRPAALHGTRGRPGRARWSRSPSSLPRGAWATPRACGACRRSSRRRSPP